MGIVRFLVIAMLAISAITMGMYLVTGNLKYKAQAMRMFTWTIGVVCVFFAVLILQRL